MMRRTHFCSVGAFAFAGHLIISLLVVSLVAVESMVAAITTLCMRCVRGGGGRRRGWIFFGFCHCGKNGGKCLHNHNNLQLALGLTTFDSNKLRPSLSMDARVMTFPLCSVDGGCKWSRHGTKSKMIRLKSYMQGIVSTNKYVKLKDAAQTYPMKNIAASLPASPPGVARDRYRTETLRRGRNRSNGSRSLLAHS